MRQIIRHIVLCTALICILCRSSMAALNNAQEFYLDNGLQVVVIPNHKAPIIKQVVLYKAGRIDEPLGKGGIAHFLEHLMFRGTQKFSDGRFNELIEQNGGYSNAATGHDYTYYHQFLSLDRLELAMYLEADRMSNLHFSEKSFIKEKNVVAQERQERLNADPTTSFWEKYERAFWQNNLYGEPVSGTEQEIEAITQTDILKFYHNYYTPQNAILILSGDIDIEIANDLAQKYYGHIKSHNRPETTIPTIDEAEYLHNQYILKAFQEDVNLGRLVGRCVFSHKDGKNKELYSLLVLSEYLSGSVNSPLYKKLKLDNPLTVSVGTYFDFLNRGNSVFSFYAYIDKPQNVAKVQSIFKETLQKDINKLSEAELKKVKTRILAGIIYENDNPSDAADIAVKWLGAGYSLQDIKNFENNIQNITLKDIFKATKKLQQCHFFWGQIMPMTGGKQ